jgi:hypothetical protein
VITTVRMYKPKGRGQTPAVGLARWYVTRAGLGDSVTRSDVSIIKSIIKSCGGADNAKMLLERHLSDSWRWVNRKSLRFVLSVLEDYKAELGLSVAGTMIPKPRCVEVRRVTARV